MTTNELYAQMGVSQRVLDFGAAVLAEIAPQFAHIDAVAEHNQAKVIQAMQENRLAAMHFNPSTGYGYDDDGRDNLERIYARIFGTEAALVRPQITCGTHALALALALHLTQEQYATLLPKSVTTAISMDVAAELGGIAALTGAIVILTGIVGNLLAETVCKAFHITDPIAKGVGIGTSAHAVGTSKALQMGEVEGAMSGLSIAVAGVLTAVLCPVFVNLID